MVEQFKHDPEEFGGSQPRLLSPEEIPQRRCAAKFCPHKGYAQLPILGQPDQWRVVCHVHAFKASKMIGDALYNPNVIEEADKIAAETGVLTADNHSPVFLHPETFRCNRCGGRMNVETGGGYAGRRWNHTCP